ncbi:MAG: TetR/AcrR family transcriptional regulator [Phycisphaerae bacterium]|nr:TetR/AcrR family transcriptional regulator [Phycisphaerae bacterium]
MSENRPSARIRRPAHRPTNRLRKSDRARRAIIDSAVKFLWTRPFRGMTVADLMARTRLSRPAFYQYFSDLHDLIEVLLREVESIMHQTANPWLSGEGEPIAALRESQKGVVQVCLDHGPIFRAVSEAAPLDERLERAWSAFTKRWDDVVEARIKSQQRDGLISKSLNARRIANALNHMDTTLLIAEFGRRPQGDPKAVLDTLHHIWTAALYGGQRAARMPRKSPRKS